MHRTKYLGLWVRKNDIRSLLTKVEEIKMINIPTKVCDVKRFLGLVNCYRDMGGERTHELATLTTLYSIKVKFKRIDVEKNSFIATKKIL